MKLEIGYNHPFEVRKYQLFLELHTNISLLYLSDLHFNGYSSKTTNDLISQIEAIDPEIILLGGDYVDNNAGLHYITKLLIAIAKNRHVLAILGNHDVFFGVDKIKHAMLVAGVVWIDGIRHKLAVNGHTIAIDGGKQMHTVPNCDLNILLLHIPIDVQSFVHNYQLVFAGHLHGCQFVFWETVKGLFPGKYFNRWNILHYMADDFTYIISKGLGDTLPIRYNCKKDVILVNIT